MTSKPMDLGRTLAGIVLLAVAYVAAGRFMLSVAPPPGFATPIFPSAGFAFAAAWMGGVRLLPGVFFGSLILSVSNGAGPTVASVIAVGATLQAWTGATLVRNALGRPSLLDRPGDALTFLALGGPLACLVGATVGVSALNAAAVVSADETLQTWWTWWCGDTIGVFLGSPITLALFAKPRPLWRPRAPALILPTVVTSIGMMLMFQQSRVWERERLEATFEQRAGDLTREIAQSIGRHVSFVDTVRRYFASSEEVSREEFSVFLEGAFRRFPGLEIIAWAPHEPGTRTEDLTIEYVLPRGPGSALRGRALADWTTVRGLVARTMSSPQPVASPVLDPLAPGLGAGPVLIVPVRGASGHSREVRGLLLAVLDAGALAEAVRARIGRLHAQVQIRDVTLPGSPVTLASVGPPPNEAWHPYVIEETNVLGRLWEVEIRDVGGVVAGPSTRDSEVVFGFGLAFTALLAGFLLTTTGQTSRAEGQVRERTVHLRESEARYRAIVENAVEAILTLDDTGRIEAANPAAERLFGYPAKELIGKPLEMLVPRTDTEHAPWDPERMLQATEDGETRTREVQAQRKDGSVVFLDVALSDLALPDRRRYTAMFHDVTRRTQVARLQSELVSTVSHELRTPLTAIRGALGLVAGGATGTVEPRAQELLGLATRNSEQLALLIDDLLDLDRIAAGRMGYDRVDLDLRDVVEAAVAHNRAFADEFGVDLVVDAPDDGSLHVVGDARRLEQVLTNLLSNAAKFSPQGGSVEIRATGGQRTVRVEVADRGPGIPDDLRTRVFDKFAQGDGSNTRARRGTGLGLAIARAITEDHGGTIGFMDRAGGGTIFWLTLPHAA